MGGVASAVTDVVGGAVDTVGDVVEDVGQTVVEDVVQPVVKTVETTVQKAMDDPIGTAVQVAAIASGQWWALPLATATVTVAHGGSLKDGLTNAAIAYAGGEIAQGVSSSLSPDLTAEFGQEAGKSMANVAGNVASTAARGGDPLQALVSGGLNAGVSAAASEVPGFADMTKGQQAAVTRAISAEMQGKDPSQGLINTAIGAGIDAAKKSEWDFGSSSPSTTNDLVDQTAPTQEQQISAPVKPTEQDTNDFYKSIGIDPSSLSNPAPSTEDPLAGINTRGDYDQITGKFVYDPNGSMEGPLPESTGSNLSSMDGYTTKDGVTTTPSGDTFDLSYLQNSGQAVSGSDLLAPAKPEQTLGDMATQFLNAAGANAPKIAAGVAGIAGIGALANQQDPLAFNNDPYAGQDVNWNGQQLAGPDQGVVYGQSQLAPDFTQKAAQGGIMALAAGGQVPSLGGYAAGGNPRLLRGPGDGMSDNIPATIAGKQPARLADGEFVVPADVVSHLGNGSTEAGANVLYQMMERVRKARTGNPKQGKQINPQKFVPNKGK